MKRKNLENKISKLPDTSGVYIFFGETNVVSNENAGKEIIYVGKATSLKNRVGSYFRKCKKNERPIEEMIHLVSDIKIIETETVLDALILEANLIKKYQPKYNVLGKDDKSFSYVAITKEEFPRVLIKRKTDIECQNSNIKMQNDSLKVKSKKKVSIQNTKYKIPHTKIYGPYVSKKQIEIALKIMRKIFPFHNRKEKSEKGCLDSQIGLCPGPYTGRISKKDYAKNIRGIKMILEGKRKGLIRKLEKEMEGFSKKEKFEKAGEIKRKIFALRHINDISLLSRDDNFGSKFKIQNSKFLRIEAYDISNISGQFAVGAMIVLDNSSGELDLNKAQYRKFKIKKVVGADDVGMMGEILSRRFHNKWKKPSLIFLDGGVGHLNMAKMVWKKLKIDIPIVAVAKGAERKNQELRIKNYASKIDTEKITKNRNLVKKIMDEAHRFAISYHRKIRGAQFRGEKNRER